jgi:hypothetical protein
LASPSLTGTPTAPTATAGTNTTQLATTAFVTTALTAKADVAQQMYIGTTAVPINRASAAITLNGVSVSGNAGTATTLSGDRTNWATNRSSAVANMLGWKNYGNDHVIFDASNATSPDGTSINNTNSAIAWSASYPTLMGWNGSTTYGVRVDSARVADNANYASTAGRAYPYRSDGGALNFYWSGQSGQPIWLWGGTDGKRHLNF